MAELFVSQLGLAAPLFILIAVGFAAIRWGGWSPELAQGMNTFVFNLALPALLFHLMSGFNRLPAVDTRLLLAFFGGCLLTFLIGRLALAPLFDLDGASASIFAIAGIFSNNVLLGIPLAKAALGPAALPSVALVLVFNALTLWTLLSVSVEWSRHGSFSLQGLRATLGAVLRNPLVMAIVLGTAFGVTGHSLPGVLDRSLSLMAEPAAPLSLIVLGMGLAIHGGQSTWRITTCLCVLKLLAQPLTVWGLARLIGLPRLETNAVVLLASLPIGTNVYLMAEQQQRLQGTIAAGLVSSTILSALSTPAILVALLAS